jgi:hypothetical protein
MRISIVKLSTIFTFFIATLAVAGDLVELPTSQEGFREKILAFIKPRNKLTEALSILEPHGFHCSSLPNQASTTVCVRNDREASSSIIRRYQVVLETDKRLVRSVRTNTGLVGP